MRKGSGWRNRLEKERRKKISSEGEQKWGKWGEKQKTTGNGNLEGLRNGQHLKLQWRSERSAPHAGILGKWLPDFRRGRFSESICSRKDCKRLEACSQEQKVGLPAKRRWGFQRLWILMPSSETTFALAPFSFWPLGTQSLYQWFGKIKIIWYSGEF